MFSIKLITFCVMLKKNLIKSCVEFINNNPFNYGSRTFHRRLERCWEVLYTIFEADSITLEHMMVMYYAEICVDMGKYLKIKTTMTDRFIKHMEVCKQFATYIIFCDVTNIVPELFNELESRIGVDEIISLNLNKETLEELRKNFPFVTFKYSFPSKPIENIVDAFTGDNIPSLNTDLQDLINFLRGKDYLMDLFNEYDTKSRDISSKCIDDMSNYINSQEEHLKLLSNVRDYSRQLVTTVNDLQTKLSKQLKEKNMIHQEKTQLQLENNNLKKIIEDHEKEIQKLKDEIEQHKIDYEDSVKTITDYHDQVDDLEIRLSQKDKILDEAVENMKRIFTSITSQISVEVKDNNPQKPPTGLRKNGH